MVEEIGLAIETPAPTSTAISALGISHTAFYNWMRKGQIVPYSVYGRLRKRVLIAESQRELHLLEIVHKAAPKDWKAAQWLARVVCPQRYRDDAPLPISYDEPDTFAIDATTDLESLTPDELQTLARAADILERLGSGTAANGEARERASQLDPVHDVHIPRLPGQLAPPSDSEET